MILKVFIKNEKGEVTILGVLMLLIALTTSGYLMKKMIHYHHQIKLRLETYTCFKKSLDLIKSSRKEMSYYNSALVAAHASKAVPNPYSIAAIQALKIAQYKVLYMYRKNVSTLKGCHLWDKAQLLKHFPYKTLGAFKLSRGMWDVTILKSNPRPLIIKARKKIITVFTLQATYKLSPSFKLVKSQEKTSLFTRIKAL